MLCPSFMPVRQLHSGFLSDVVKMHPFKALDLVLSAQSVGQDVTESPRESRFQSYDTEILVGGYILIFKPAKGH